MPGVMTGLKHDRETVSEHPTYKALAVTGPSLWCSLQLIVRYKIMVLQDYGVVSEGEGCSGALRVSG